MLGTDLVTALLEADHDVTGLDPGRPRHHLRRRRSTRPCGATRSWSTPPRGPRSTTPRPTRARPSRSTRSGPALLGGGLRPDRGPAGPRVDRLRRRRRPGRHPGARRRPASPRRAPTAGPRRRGSGPCAPRAPTPSCCGRRGCTAPTGRASRRRWRAWPASATRCRSSRTRSASRRGPSTSPTSSCACSPPASPPARTPRRRPAGRPGTSSRRRWSAPWAATPTWSSRSRASSSCAPPRGPAWSVLAHDTLKAAGVAPIGAWRLRWAEAADEVLAGLSRPGRRRRAGRAVRRRCAPARRPAPAPRRAGPCAARPSRRRPTPRSTSRASRPGPSSDAAGPRRGRAERGLRARGGQDVGEAGHLAAVVDARRRAARPAARPPPGAGRRHARPSSAGRRRVRAEDLVLPDHLDVGRRAVVPVQHLAPRGTRRPARTPAPASPRPRRTSDPAAGDDVGLLQRAGGRSWPPR